MGADGQKIIPGEEATAEQILELAEEFRNSAILLYEKGRRGRRLAWSPFRFIFNSCS